MNSTLTKCISLILCPYLAVYSLPVAAFTVDSDVLKELKKNKLTDEVMKQIVGANGTVTAKMADYKLGGTVAKATITNRFTLDCKYELNLVNSNGIVIQTLTSGVIKAGETKLIMGTPPVGGTQNRYIQARIFNESLTGIEAIDSSWAVSSVDSDADGITDVLENLNGLNPFDPTDALADLDGDNLTNLEEINLHMTDIRNPDSDNDGINDGAEIDNGLNPKFAGDANIDPDRDFLTNAEEINIHGSDINVANPGLAPDMDGDGLNDRLEIALGLDPDDDDDNSVGLDSFNDKKIAHVINRLTFGPTPDLFADIKNKGISVWIDEQLTSIGLDATPADPAQGMRDNHYTSFGFAERIGAIRPVHSTSHLQSRMGLFWDNHFSTSVAKTRTEEELYEEDLFFTNAFSSFRNLLGISAKGDAMLRYLDLRNSKKAEPNENYPREVMELHTLGQTTDLGLYNASTIVELSKILTGWSSNVPGTLTSRYTVRHNDSNGDPLIKKFDLRLFQFRTNDHDITEKTLTLGGVSYAFAAGGGVEEGDRALDILASLEATANNICTKLTRHFVSDNPWPQTIDSCEHTYLATINEPDQIKHILEDIFYSYEFNSPSTFRSKFKDNQEYMFGLARILGVNAIGNTALNGHVNDNQSLGERIEDMGQGQFQKPEPTGWDEDASAWIKSDVVLNRFREGSKMVQAKSATYFVDYFTGLGLNTSSDVMAHLFQVLLGSHYDVKHMTMAYWVLHSGHSSFDVTDADAETKIKNLIMRLIQLPEYNLH
ncbi:MAG: DUF1800 family protein [Pseudomonadota bacterium]